MSTAKRVTAFAIGSMSCASSIPDSGFSYAKKFCDHFAHAGGKAAMKLRVHRHFLALASAFAMSLTTMGGCAGRIVTPAPIGASNQPRAAWTIRAGSEYGFEREVCRSDQDQLCIVPASTADRPTHAVVSVYLYPAAATTNYSGAFLSEFVGHGNREVKVDEIVAPGRPPSYVASSGIVTSVPGVYEFRMALFATVPGQPDPFQFQRLIEVRVESSAPIRKTS